MSFMNLSFLDIRLEWCYNKFWHHSPWSKLQQHFLSHPVSASPVHAEQLTRYET